MSQFHGRQLELIRLRQWLVADRCRLVAVLDMDGQDNDNPYYAGGECFVGM